VKTAKLRVIVIAVVMTAFFALPANTALGATFTVTTTADSGPGSLRQAIIDANDSGAADTISFDPAVFPPGSPATITLTSSLWLTGGGDTVDALVPTAGVVVRGPESRDFDCFFIDSDHNSVRGLQFTDCRTAIVIAFDKIGNTIGPGNTIFDSLTAVEVFGVGNTVVGNKIGTTPDGSAIPAEGSNAKGVYVTGAINVVGGVSPDKRNIISGHATGVEIEGTFATDNVVVGNYIGTDADGLVDLGNAEGVFVTEGASGNYIGGTLPGEGNLISGNDVFNVVIYNASNNTVSGNIIGPDLVGGGGTMANGTGVQISGPALNNTVGPGNVISGNGHGVYMEGGGTSGNIVRGNLIGTDVSGNAPVPNAVGVAIESGPRFNLVGAVAAGDGNLIAFSTFDGVLVDASVRTTTGNEIRGNSILANGGLPINNSNGGNLELIPPAILSSDGHTVTGLACPYCEVDVFSSQGAGPRIYEGWTIASAGGDWGLTKDGGLQGPILVATQTDIFGNTSEVSIEIGVDDNDGDGIGDAVDPDDDNDGLGDENDLCPLIEEDFDGFDDSDGCPDPDNDGDGICDPGMVSVSCTGADVGQQVFDPAGTIPQPEIDCRNVAEDFDGFRDGDGCPEPDNDNDGFPDATDDCPGTDAIAGADGMLGSPEDLNHNGVQDGAESPLTTDDTPLALSFEDYDGVIDTDGCHDSPGDDFDDDGWTDEEEALDLGTNAALGCPLTSARNDEEPDAWPPDWDDSQSVNLLDLLLFKQHFGVTDPLDPKYEARYDLNIDDAINLLDVLAFKPFFGKSCSP
jgi:hypothetical protein